MYYIKNIKITTFNGVTSVLPLKNGLNIIYGPSNTGKSLVLDCIDFLMGSKGRNENNRSEESISYKRLSKSELKIASIALSIDVNGKTIALFGMGDSSSYSDTYCNGMGILFEKFSAKGAKIVGAVSTDGYTFDESEAVKDGKFVGLALDADNESDKTEERISNWVEQIRSDFA